MTRAGKRVTLMHRLLVFALCAILGLSTWTEAQGPRRSRRSDDRLGRLSLVSIPEVQVELKTSPEQMQLIFTLQADLREQVRNTLIAASEARPTRPMEADTAPSESTSPSGDESLSQLEQTANALVSTILDARQSQRLSELWWQYAGPRSWLRPEAQARLTLTPAQREQIETLLKSASPAEVRDKALEILTPQQGQGWTQMQGTPFTFPKPQRRGR